MIKEAGTGRGGGNEPLVEFRGPTGKQHQGISTATGLTWGQDTAQPQCTWWCLFPFGTEGPQGLWLVTPKETGTSASPLCGVSSQVFTPAASRSPPGRSAQLWRASIRAAASACGQALLGAGHGGGYRCTSSAPFQLPHAPHKGGQGLGHAKKGHQGHASMHGSADGATRSRGDPAQLGHFQHVSSDHRPQPNPGGCREGGEHSGDCACQCYQCLVTDSQQKPVPKKPPQDGCFTWRCSAP